MCGKLVKKYYGVLFYIYKCFGIIKIGISESDLHFKPYKYVNSNDKEMIADMLDKFEYDPSQKEEILAKYEDLKKYIK